MLKFYYALPVLFQNVICTLYGYKEKRKRFGNGFREWYNYLQKSEFDSEKEIEQYQFQQLRVLFDEAYKYVPYYKNLFNNLSINPSSIHGYEDLNKISILTKEMIKKHHSQFTNTQFEKKNLHISRTSGSTESPL